MSAAATEIVCADSQQITLVSYPRLQQQLITGHCTYSKAQTRKAYVKVTEHQTIRHLLATLDNSITECPPLDTMDTHICHVMHSGMAATEAKNEWPSPNHVP